MPLSARRQIVYCRRGKGVNRHGEFDKFVPILCGLGVLSGGCVLTPAADPGGYWIAARYDVEPRLNAGVLSDNEDVIRHDLKAIADLGLGGVVLCHVEDGNRGRLLELADEVRLRAAIPDRRFDRFVVTGGLPAQCRDANELVRDVSDETVRHPAFHGYVVEGGRGSAARERSRMLRAKLDRQGVPSVSLGDRDDAPLAVIDAGVVREGPPGMAIERLLAKYHAALCAGQTGGVIVDRFMRLPGDPPGLASADEPLLPAHSSAIRALTQRARNWGPRLSGLPASSLTPTTDSSWLSVTALGRGTRRYVLVFNTSTDQFAREEILLPALILDQAVLRVVEVPPSMDRGAGRVIHSRSGELTLPIELRPGDAALYEIIW